MDEAGLLIRDTDLSALEVVIRRLETSEPLASERVRSLSAAHRRETSRRMVEEGLSWAAASGELLHLDRPDAQRYLKEIQNDLAAQVEIFANGVEAWFRHASRPAPGYTWRITVILRKAKMFDLERRFLAAYFKHFYLAWGSVRDRDLGIRAIKIGIDIPAPRDNATLQAGP